MNEIEKELKLSKKQNYNDRYNYLCSNCGSIEWSSFKEKSKYKWYKYSKEEIQRLLKGSE